MADFPDDAPPSTRRTIVPLPPFVVPRGGAAGMSRRTPQRGGAQQSGRRAPARLYTPPDTATSRPRPVVPSSVPAAAPPARSMGDEPARPAGAPVEPIYTAPQPAPAPAVPSTPPASAPTSHEVAASDEDAPTSWGNRDIPYAAAEYAPGVYAPAESAPAESAPAEHVLAEPESRDDSQRDGDGVEQVDDDWFAEDERDSQAMPVEPARPTPAFGELSGIEQLAPTAPSDGAWAPPAPAMPLPDAQAVEPAASTEPVAPPASFERDSRAVVAAALERVALRVRDGDVVLPTDLPSSSEAAALAAVLAALLRTPSR